MVSACSASTWSANCTCPRGPPTGTWHSLAPSLVGLLRPELAAVRARWTATGPAAATIDLRYQQVESVLERASATMLASVGQEMALTSEGTALSRSLQALGACLRLSSKRRRLKTRTTRLRFYGAPTARKAAAVRWPATTGQYEKAGQQLAGSAVPAVARAWGPSWPTRRSSSTSSSWSMQSRECPSPTAPAGSTQPPTASPWQHWPARSGATWCTGSSHLALIGQASASLRQADLSLGQPTRRPTSCG